MKKIYYKKFFLIFFNIFIIFIIFSCINNRQYYPKRVYMPDMYYSEAYEVYSEIKKNNVTSNVLLFKKNGQSSSLSPVIGTVSRNKYNLLPYNISNNNNGYEISKKNNYSPLNQNNKKKNIKRGKEMYIMNCSICHGENGDGQGILVQKEKILGVPNYKNINITIGSIYHVIMYGKNIMGSYSSQLNELDRWKVAEYVLKLKNE